MPCEINGDDVVLYVLVSSEGGCSVGMHSELANGVSAVVMHMYAVGVHGYVE
jgi:hypothetical protein